MGTQLDVALMQLSPHGRDTNGNLEKGLATWRDAAVAGAQTALFPEMWSIGYDLRDGESADALRREAIGREDGVVNAFADAAAELESASERFRSGGAGPTGSASNDQKRCWRGNDQI